MEQRQESRVIPFPNEDEEQSVPIRVEEYETLSKAFQSFSEASIRLQERYEELRDESKTLRVELEKKEVEIKRSERLATLGETAAALAHEIRNPLGAISLYTSLLKEDLTEQPDQHELVTAIDRSVTTLNHVVSNILHFAKNSEPTLAPASLEAILQEICSDFSRVHSEAQISLRTRGNLFVWADQTGIRQLFSNLLLNALQAQGLQGAVHVIAHGRADNVAIRVRDNGSGIPEESLDQIFEPFTTSKPEGTGLGLAICREIARIHKAEIAASNRKNGAQFTLLFNRFPEKQVKEKGNE